MHGVRIPDEEWTLAQRIAPLRGETVSDVVRKALRSYNRRHRHLLDEAPGDTAPESADETTE